eukprot:7385896-Prymnesium_polylepis.1
MRLVDTQAALVPTAEERGAFGAAGCVRACAHRARVVLREYLHDGRAHAAARDTIVLDLRARRHTQPHLRAAGAGAAVGARAGMDARAGRERCMGGGLRLSLRTACCGVRPYEVWLVKGHTALCPARFVVVLRQERVQKRGRAHIGPHIEAVARVEGEAGGHAGMVRVLRVRRCVRVAEPQQVAHLVRDRRLKVVAVPARDEDAR